MDTPVQRSVWRKLREDAELEMCAHGEYATMTVVAREFLALLGCVDVLESRVAAAEAAQVETVRLRENERVLRWAVTQYARALRDRQERNWQAAEESLGATKESFRWVASTYVGAQQLLIETLRDSGIDPKFVSGAALAATEPEAG